MMNLFPNFTLKNGALESMLFLFQPIEQAHVICGPYIDSVN